VRVSSLDLDLTTRLIARGQNYFDIPRAPIPDLGYRFGAYNGQSGALGVVTEACARRLARMLGQLASLHPIFANWKKKGRTRAKAQAPFCSMPPRVEELTGIFEKARHYTDATHELMPKLGYSVNAWNGVDGDRGVSFRAAVGKYNGWHVNMVEIVVPFPERDNRGLVDRRTREVRPALRRGGLEAGVGERVRSTL
jgi:hypothetical protein